MVSSGTLWNGVERGQVEGEQADLGTRPAGRSHGLEAPSFASREDQPRPCASEGEGEGSADAGGSPGDPHDLPDEGVTCHSGLNVHEPRALCP